MYEILGIHLKETSVLKIIYNLKYDYIIIHKNIYQASLIILLPFFIFLNSFFFTSESIVYAIICSENLPDNVFTSDK